MLARLETLFQTQQRLVADVSHELRTPLTTIQGNLDLLRRGAADDPAMRGDALRAIGDETARMRRLVNDLLLLAQADAGLKLNLQPVELDTLLLDVYRQAQRDGRRCRLCGSARKIRRSCRVTLTGCANSCLNLVVNALKYTPAGGEVTLGMRRRAVGCRSAVSDTGVGIAPEDLAHIFDRFYRADPSRACSGGFGLGLPIAQWIAQAHGGRIEVASKVGKGSTFTLWLPEVRSGGVRERSELRKENNQARHTAPNSRTHWPASSAVCYAARGLTLALAESCTGGLIGSLITDVAGSSDYFLGSAVTYANSAKQNLLGVRPETLLAHGAVSAETAAEMAQGARRLFGADHRGLSHRDRRAGWRHAWQARGPGAYPPVGGRRGDRRAARVGRGPDGEQVAVGRGGVEVGGAVFGG